MTPEFDRYASTYCDLLRDPLRDRFTADPAFFHERKLAVIRDFFFRHRMQSLTQRWLDVGCGQADLLSLASGDFADAVGCDPSEGMLDASDSARVLRQPSLTDLPFPDESFDFVTAVCVYHHVHGADRTSLTKSIHRVLKPSGVFCMIEHNPWNPVTQAIVRRCPVDRDADLLTATTAVRLVRSLRFRPIETDFFLYFPEPLFHRAATIERYLRRVPLGGQFALFSHKPQTSKPTVYRHAL